MRRKMLLDLLLISSFLIASSHPATAQAPAASYDLATIAEKSGWKKTGRYDEVVRLCQDFPKAFPGRVRCFDFGITPEGRPMLALVASDDGVLDSQAASTKKREVVLAQGGIHAGEIDGKDAGFKLLQDLLEGKALPGILRKLTFVFVPVYNIDGHERFGAYNRPNQRGPEEMGWRVTGQNLNLNRDYLKADAPETQAMIRLLNEWDPILYLDLHVTDGADFQHDISISVAPAQEGPVRDLVKAGKELEQDAVARLRKMKHLPLWVYPEFEKTDDPSSGVSVGVSSPRFSQAYWAARNRLGVLVELHSWKDYSTRIQAMRDTLVTLLSIAQEDASSWRKKARAADETTAKLAGKEIALSYEKTGKPKTLDFLGYHYTRDLSAISGKLMTRYDSTQPEVWHIPFWDELKPKLSVKAPGAGYIVSPAHAEWVAAKLKLHGVSFEPVTQTKPGFDLETFRAQSAEWSKQSYEGRTRLELKGAWAPEKREIPRGSLFVPIAQPHAYLAMQLFEPGAPDSFVGWGYFNSAFEQREYMEPYVAEAVATEMMAKDPKIKSEFLAKLDADADFAKNPDKRLEFFYRKHPSWDERYMLYPVFRIAKKP